MPAADVWYQWNQTFLDYVDLFPSMNNAASVTEVLEHNLLFNLTCVTNW